MALTAGTMTITLQFAKDLKDKDWFGKQDPYVNVKCGSMMLRTKTATDGGKNPVWNESFTFNVLNENQIELEIKDEDLITKDDVIGIATVSLAKAREHGEDTLQVPVVSKKSKKQHGFIQVTLKFATNDSLKAAPAAAAAPQQPQVVYMQAPPQMVYAAPGQMAYPPPGMPGAHPPAGH